VNQKLIGADMEKLHISSFKKKTFQITKKAKMTVEGVDKIYQIQRTE
jgi:hypothetical protein